MKGIGVVVLAAGGSKRFGPEPKQLALVDGVPLLRRVVDEVQYANPAWLVVVLGAEASMVATIVPEGVAQVDCSQWALGQSESVKAGADFAMQSNCKAAIFLPGDMPWVSHGLLLHLAERFHEAGEEALYVTTFKGQRRPPVLVPRSLLPHARELSGDEGWRALFDILPVVEVPGDAFGSAQDIDTPGDLPRR